MGRTGNGSVRLVAGETQMESTAAAYAGVVATLFWRRWRGAAGATGPSTSFGLSFAFCH